MLHVVLYEPEIPQNAGNIARLCAAVGAELHLIEPLGFFLDDRQLRRAGLDYWQDVQVKSHRSWPDFLTAYPGSSRWYLTTKGRRSYADQPLAGEVHLVFGPESRGLPSDLLAAEPERCLRVPMRPGARSLNLANTVAIVVFEVLRQRGFPGLI
ncbi:MAG: tRNA (cytidine(34)-2'-O)-methyltransferase [Bacteroidota bacterium]